MRTTCEGEEGNIARLVEVVRGARKPIEVDDVRIEYSDPTGGFKSFGVRTGDQLTEMLEGLARARRTFQMLDKQDIVINEMCFLSSSMHDMMDARFQRLEDEISKIKARLHDTAPRPCARPRRGKSSCPARFRAVFSGQSVLHCGQDCIADLP